jgi:hypothetical protein
VGDWADEVAEHALGKLCNLIAFSPDDTAIIAAALRKARADALEEAAVIADRMSDRLNIDDGGTACVQVADEIRALKDKLACG